MQRSEEGPGKERGPSSRWPFLVESGQPSRTDDSQGRFPQLRFLDAPSLLLEPFLGHIGPSWMCA